MCVRTGKFTYVSPVWLQIRSDDRGEVVITGTHDIDAGWVSDVRAPCRQSGAAVCPQVVPRVVWEVSQCDGECMREVIIAVVNTLVHYKFDGLVLEFQQVLYAVCRGWID